MASKPKHSAQDMAHGNSTKTKAGDVWQGRLISLPVGQEDVVVLAIKKKECQEKK